MTTYPLDLPAELLAQSAQILGIDFVGMSESEFTGIQQSHAHPGELWQIDIELPPMTRQDIGPWAGWLFSLKGTHGTFLCGDPGYEGPYGIGTGAPVVMGASQTGSELVTDGWTISTAGILLRGDLFQLGTGATSRLYMLTADADSDGSGVSTLQIWPALRSSPADNAPLTLADPRSVFRLTQAFPIQYDKANIAYLTFSAREALP